MMRTRRVLDPILQSHRGLLSDFAGEKQWDQRDPFWQELLSFREPLTSFSPIALDDALLPYCRQVATNNAKTFNFQVLLQRMVLQVQEMDSQKDALAAADTIVLVRVFMKYLIETLNSDDLVAFLDAPQRMTARHGRPSTQDDSWVNQIIAAILLVLTTIHVGSTTYLLHLVTLHLLLVVCSTQLASATPLLAAGNNPFLEVLLDNKRLTQKLTSVLLRHYSDFRPLPPKAPLYQPDQDEPAGVFRLVRSAAASLLWLPVHAITFLTRSKTEVDSLSPLAETSLLVLLLLAFQAPGPGHDNPVCWAIQTLSDNGDQIVRRGSESPPSVGRRDERISFEQLYISLGAHMDSEMAVLLLYDLLHRNAAFKGFIISHSDPAKLLVPLAKLLYTSEDLNSSQTYLLLVVVLLLTQNAELSLRMHESTVASVPWYHDRLLKDISLGSLFMILLLRIATRSLAKSNDTYLSTNAVAALVNLAIRMKNVDSHAASRLIKLIDALGKRFMRLSRGSGGLNAEQAEAYREEAQNYGDLNRLLLEMLSFTVVRNLKSNPELVYALLHKAEVFDDPEIGEQFADLLDNPRLVINHFNHEVDLARGSSGNAWNVSDLLVLIKERLEEWPGGYQLKEFKELRFSYEEEASPADFFVPYAWTLIVSHTQSLLAWNQESFVLLPPMQPSNSNDRLETLNESESQSQGLELSEALNSV